MQLVRLRSTSLLALFLVTGCLMPSGSPREVERHDAKTFYSTTSFTGAAFSPDGKRLLVSCDESGIFNAYALDIENGALEQLTRSTTNAVFSVDFFPDDERFLYTSDQGGNELNHLYVQLPDGKALDLTPGDELKAMFVRWGADERSFYVLTNERDPQFFDLYRYRFGPVTAIEAAAKDEIAPGFQRELLFQNPGGYDISNVSRDGRWVALTKSNDNADSDVFLGRTDSPDAELLHVTPHTGKVQNSVADFSPDGRTLYLTSNEASEYDRVWSYDIESGKRELAFEDDDWDVSFYYFSEDGRWLVTGVNEDARTELGVQDADSGREVELPRMPAGDVTGVSFEEGGSRMAFYVNGDTSPSNIHVLDLGNRRHERLTSALDPAIAQEDLVEAENVRYESFDGLEIPALLYRPHPASRENPVPALVWVHGGPGGQSRHGYNATLQHLVNHGYAVLAVNNRGSSGYGKTFFHADDRKHGIEDLQDCIHGRRYLETLDWVDGKRVGIIGGSYGGYMVCAALAFEPQSFDVGVDIFGVTNWLRTLESIPPWWESFRADLYAELGDPAVDRERLEARSPLLHAAKIEKPLLVIQGKNDPRVIEAESEEIAAAVRKKGVPVEYICFPDEGHGFRNKENRIRASEAYVTFLDRYLKATPAN